MNHYTFIVTIALFIWAIDTGPEALAPVPKVNKPLSPKSAMDNSNHRNEGKRFTGKNWDQIESEAFILLFSHQAQRSLLSCLKSWRTSPTELVLSATLVKSTGRLTNIAPIDKSISLPKCAVTAIGAMDFSHLSQQLKRDNHDLQWRVDW